MPACFASYRLASVEVADAEPKLNASVADGEPKLNDSVALGAVTFWILQRRQHQRVKHNFRALRHT